MSAVEKFQELLHELFQFEASDLDFGIYRILNFKREQIDKFIKEDIKNQIEEAFARHKDERFKDISEKFEEAKQKVLETLGANAFTPTGELKPEFANTPVGKDYLQVKEQRDSAQKIDEIKLQVFNDLYSFFSRYYEEGDFIPQYRHSIKSHKYAIPYNGEEVKLYWTNADQYYTKTGILFRDYTFYTDPGKAYKIIFRTVSASEELGSNKATKARFFVLDDENPVHSPSQKGWQANPDGVVKWNELPYNPELKEKARELRKAGNLSEVLLWEKVKNKQFLGLDFDRQKIIGNYIVDFYCKNLGIVVEIDGESHELKGEYDEDRENYLKGLGLRVFHIPDKDIKQNLEGVLEYLEQEILNTPSLRDTPLQEGNILLIRFQYRELTEKEVKSYSVEGGSNTAKQDKINQKIFDEILSLLKNSPSLKGCQPKVDGVVNGNLLRGLLSKEYKNEKPLLLYQISRFTAKNTKDYFIHKNLKRFLSEQLDYFIKADVLSITTLENEPFLDKHITRAKVVREIGEKIIDFLAQIEDFQKRLWEKKKFVLKTDYVITLDRVPEEFHKEILKNKEQLKEWKDLGLDVIPAKAGIQKLPVDTRYFSEAFKERLLEKLTKNADLDDLLDGILIKSENFQALNLLLNKYKGEVQTIYIDPPFNKETEADYLYSVRYKDSTWISMLENRLKLARDLMNEKGNILVKCDYNGNMFVRMLMNEIFGVDKFRSELIWKRFTGTKIQYKHFAIVTDTIYAYSKSDDWLYKQQYQEYTEKYIASQFKHEDARGKYLLRNFYSAGDGPPRKYFGKLIPPPKGSHWRFTQENIDQLIADKRIVLDSKGFPKLKMYLHEMQGNPYNNLLTEFHVVQGSSTEFWDFATQNPEKLIRLLIDSTSNKNNFILDFFLGSGTTTAVAHKTGRKWIGVEMGGHFYTVVLPRMKKVLWGEMSGISKELKKNTPSANADTPLKEGNLNVGGFFKYQVLEQYEDSLDNIELKESKQAESLFKDDYLLKYFLEFETQESPYLMNIESLKDSFSYKLRVNPEEVGEPVEMAVDLPETFN